MDSLVDEKVHLFALSFRLSNDNGAHEEMIRAIRFSTLQDCCQPFFQSG